VNHYIREENKSLVSAFKSLRLNLIILSIVLVSRDLFFYPKQAHFFLILAALIMPVLTVRKYLLVFIYVTFDLVKNSIDFGFLLLQTIMFSIALNMMLKGANIYGKIGFPLLLFAFWFHPFDIMLQKIIKEKGL
jgi:hypothetical protein